MREVSVGWWDGRHRADWRSDTANLAEVGDPRLIGRESPRHSSSINGEVIGHGRNLFNPGGGMHIRADDLLDDENWHGSCFELAVMLGAPNDPDADVRLQHARAAVWGDERLDGCYLDRRRSPESQVRADPELTGVELNAPVYGRARLPSGVTVVCVTYVIREEGQNAADWLDLCLPTGALERVIPQLDYPLHKDGSRVWREPIDAWLMGVAERVSSSTGFLAALIGEEVSGHPALGPAGEPIPDVQARTSVLTRTDDGVNWHRPLNW